MSFNPPTATEYLAAGDLPQVGDARIPHISPLDFGKQPRGFINKDVVNGKPRKILVAGGGDVWNKFARAALEHRGVEIFMYDPALLKGTPEERAAARAAVGIDEAHCVKPDASGKFPIIPEGTDALVVLTAPHLHAPYIQWAQDKGLPTIVEKPLVNELADFDKLDRLTLKTPLYCMDWKAAHAMPLAVLVNKALHGKALYGDLVPPQDLEVLKQFDFNHIVHASGSMVEASAFGDMDHVKKDRPDIYAGGVLRDMGVHPMAALANMGFAPGEVTSATLGDTEGQTQKGIYRKVGQETTPAWYGRAELTSHFNGQEIPTTIEAGKGGAIEEDYVSLVDANGHELRWHWDGKEKASHVTLTVGDKIHEIKVASIDPYALMFDEAFHFIDKQKGTEKPTALYYHEQKSILKAVMEMERIGRTTAAKPDEQVKQLALEPHAQLDMSRAQVTAQEPERTM